MPRTTFTYDGKRYDVTAKTEKELTSKIALMKKKLKDKTKLTVQSCMPTKQ